MSSLERDDPDRLLITLEKLLAIPAAELENALSYACIIFRTADKSEVMAVLRKTAGKVEPDIPLLAEEGNVVSSDPQSPIPIIKTT